MNLSLSLQFIDNEQSLLVSEAHLDNDLPEAMKAVLHLAEAAKAATIGRVSRSLGIGGTGAKGGMYSIMETNEPPAADQPPGPPPQSKLASIMEALRPVQTQRAAGAADSGNVVRPGSPVKTAAGAAGGSAAMAGVVEIFRKTAALGRGNSRHLSSTQGGRATGEHEKAPLLMGTVDSNNRPPIRGGMGGDYSLQPQGSRRSTATVSAVSVGPYGSGLSDAQPLGGGGMSSALLVAAGKRMPAAGGGGASALMAAQAGGGNAMGSRLAAGSSLPRSVELFSYLEPTRGGGSAPANKGVDPNQPPSAGNLKKD